MLPFHSMEVADAAFQEVDEKVNAENHYALDDDKFVEVVEVDDYESVTTSSKMCNNTP